MTDVVDVLRADHAEQQAAVARLQSLPHRRSDEGLVVKTEQARFVAAASVHEAAEEMHLWPQVRARWADGDGLAERGLAQEHEAEEILLRLGMRTPTEPGWEEDLDRFAGVLADHITYEETVVLARIEREWPVEVRRDIGTQLQAAKRTAPTRPHPAGPQGPAGLASLGRLAAVADRIGDAITGRREPFTGSGRDDRSPREPPGAS